MALFGIQQTTGTTNEFLKMKYSVMSKLNLIIQINKQDLMGHIAALNPMNKSLLKVRF